MTDNSLPKFKHLATETLVTLHREVGQELKMREGFPKIDFPASRIAEEDKNVQMVGRLLPPGKLVTDYPTSLDTFAELAKLLPLPEKDISDLVEILKRNPQQDPGLDGDVVSVHGYYGRDPDLKLRPKDILPHGEHMLDLMRTSTVAQAPLNIPTPEEFIKSVDQFMIESLSLRQTAKEKMLAAEDETLTMEQRFIPWVNGVEMGTCMVLALKHGDATTSAWILLLQNLREGSVITINHPEHGCIQKEVYVTSVSFYDIDKGWKDVVMKVEVSDLNTIEQGRTSAKFYTSLNEDLLDEHMVPVVNHEWIVIQTSHPFPQSAE